MDQQNQAINSFSPSDATVKRKRGRPKKEKSPNSAKPGYGPRKRDPSQNFGERAPVPPGFEVTNGNQLQSVDVVNNNNVDSMIGQVVTGVIEAVFDAGYLLSVRVGESNTSLRGVVFKTGHYVPVSAENDVAPSLQMIRRNEVPLPVGLQGHQRRGREESEHYTANQSNGSNQVARVRARPLSIIPAPSPGPSTLDARGTVVPVVLQPVNSSNGAKPAVEAPHIASQPAHLAATKGKHITPTFLIQDGAPKQSQTYSSSPTQHVEEGANAVKKIRRSPESAETRNDVGESSRNMLPNDSGLTQEKDEELSQPLFVEPLQTIHPGDPDHSASISHTFPERRPGKMTELLLAVQENLERQMSDGQHPEFRNPEK